jgi:hypothetical protein
MVQLNLRELQDKADLLSLREKIMRDGIFSTIVTSSTFGKHSTSETTATVSERMPNVKLAVFDGTSLKSNGNVVKVNNNKEIVKNEKIEIDLGIAKALVSKNLISSWADTFPKEYLELELKKARSWLLANEHKAPKKDYAKFLNNWFNGGWEKYRKTLPSNQTKTSVEDLMNFMGWENE